MDIKDTKKKGIKLNISVIIKLVLIGLIFFGTSITRAYIAKETFHECSGDHCEICEVLTTARRTVDALDAIGAVSLALIIIHYILIKKILYFFKNIITKSPVKLKVRLRN